jgi:hypothetical protein
MKKSLQAISFFVFLLVLIEGSSVYGQQPCGAGSHQVFSQASSQTPVTLNRLGTSPQFGEIPNHTAKSAYDHLSKIYAKNVRNSKSEINMFLSGLGYTGFKDPMFNASKISPETLSKGQTGWMGAYSKGHKYKWSVLGKDFPTFKISSKDGSCYAYIMKKCGNAFFDPAPRDEALKALAFANAKPKVVCKTQTLNFTGKGSIQAGDVINTTKTFPVVASYNGSNLCMGDFTVPVRLTYDMTASGDVNYAKTVEVCDYGNGAPAAMNLNLPLNIKYNLAASDVNIGEDGKMMANVSKKQFKALKKVYGVCPNNSATAPTNTTLAATKVNNVSTASPATTVGGGNGEKCVKQTLNISGTAQTEDVSTKTNTQEVTIIGMYKKVGKLEKGETAEKFMCLGTYNVPAKSSLQYALNSNSNLEQIIEVCDNGSVNPVENISLPLNMKHSFTKQEVGVGDYGKIYTSLTKKQYKKLSKSFKRCCKDGSSKCS